MFFSTDIAVGSVHVHLEIIWTERHRGERGEGGEGREIVGKGAEEEKGNVEREKSVISQKLELSKTQGKTHHRFMIVVYCTMQSLWRPCSLSSSPFIIILSNFCVYTRCVDY